MSAIYIGIDNGISGGITAIGPCGSWIGATRMLVRKHRGKSEIDIRAIHLWLTQITDGNLSRADYIVEEPSGSKSAQAGISMAGSFHCLRGFFETKMLNWERIRPTEWQKVILGKRAPGETKERALQVARQLWPNETFHATPRSKTPHDGIIDAALLAEFLRRQNEI